MEKNVTSTAAVETYYKCNHCGDEIFWNTHKQFVSCTCGKLGVDGCPDYVRVIGNKESFTVTRK